MATFRAASSRTRPPRSSQSFSRACFGGNLLRYTPKRAKSLSDPILPGNPEGRVTPRSKPLKTKAQEPSLPKKGWLNSTTPHWSGNELLRAWRTRCVPEGRLLHESRQTGSRERYPSHLPRLHQQAPHPSPCLSPSGERLLSAMRENFSRNGVNGSSTFERYRRKRHISSLPGPGPGVEDLLDLLSGDGQRGKESDRPLTGWQGQHPLSLKCF